MRVKCFFPYTVFFKHNTLLQNEGIKSEAHTKNRLKVWAIEIVMLALANTINYGSGEKCQCTAWRSQLNQPLLACSTLPPWWTDLSNNSPPVTSSNTRLISAGVSKISFSLIWQKVAWKKESVSLEEFKNIRWLIFDVVKGSNLWLTFA